MVFLLEAKVNMIVIVIVMPSFTLKNSQNLFSGVESNIDKIIFSEFSMFGVAWCNHTAVKDTRLLHYHYHYHCNYNYNIVSIMNSIKYP